ncbi:hypothetical protein D1007_23098 [Hordeum vulgare]|nr:hypothetical protein D1007_23098 [Hordeum vulgare]
MLLKHGPLFDAWDMLAQLEVDFRDAKACLAVECAGLAARWRQLDASAKEAHDKAEAVHAKGHRVAAEAKDARASALAEKETLTKHCEETQASLKAL